MSIRIRALIVFLAASFSLVGLLATIVAFESISDKSQRLNDEITSAIIDAQALVRGLIAAESGVRGYIATADPAFLQPYQGASSDVPSAAQALRAAVNGGILPPSAASEISRSTTRLLATLQQEVALTASGNRAAALRSLRTSEEIQMDAARGPIAAQIARWRELRVKNAANLDHLRDVLLGLMVAVSLMVVAGLLSSLRFFGFRSVRRIAVLSENIQRTVRGEPLLPPMPGKHELARLDAELHEMSRTIAEREAVMARFRIIFEQARDAISFIDFSSGKIIDANPAASRLYGYNREEMIGMPGALLRAPELRVEHDEFLTQAFEGGASTDTIGVRKDGTRFPVETTIRGATINGTRVIVAVIRDATERQQMRGELLAALDDAVRASRVKSEFVAGISHEIRTPMNGIVGMTDLLLRTRLDAEQREYAETVRESAEALLRIIGDILDFSKIEAGKVEIETAAFDLRRVVESTAAIIGANAARKGIGLMTFVDPRLPSLVRGDGGRLRQVLLNLTGNAIKFTKQGCVTLSVEPGDEGTIRFNVIDTGIGMSAETLERLFKPFSQGDASTTRRYGGTGLGLSISHRLVELMGGKLDVASREGAGSRFWFMLPLPVVSEGDGVITLRGRRCAIVVADETARAMLERYALSWQMPVIASAEPDDARFVGAFDVAIVDARGAGVARRVSVDRVVSIIDDSSEGDLRARSSILRTPLTQSAVYEALDEAFAAAREQIADSDTPEPLGVRVLLAEDNAVNQRVARKQLERIGCTVVIASTGREALEQLEDGQFDVVLMDCHMPEMDGYTASREVRKHEETLGRHVPIIALTAGAMEEDRQMCLAAGMDDFLSKPIQLDALQSALKRWTVDRQTAKEVPA